MICAGCRRKLEVGDLYIKDTASGFIGEDADPAIDELIAAVMGGQGGEVYYCEDCTEDGGDYLFETVYGDEDDTVPVEGRR